MIDLRFLVGLAKYTYEYQTSQISYLLYVLVLYKSLLTSSHCHLLFLLQNDPLLFLKSPTPLLRYLCTMIIVGPSLTWSTAFRTMKKFSFSFVGALSFIVYTPMISVYTRFLQNDSNGILEVL